MRVEVGGVKGLNYLFFSQKTRVYAIPMSICYVLRKVDWWVCIGVLSTA